MNAFKKKKYSRLIIVPIMVILIALVLLLPTVKNLSTIILFTSENYRIDGNPSNSHIVGNDHYYFYEYGNPVDLEVRPLEVVGNIYSNESSGGSPTGDEYRIGGTTGIAMDYQEGSRLIDPITFRGNLYGNFSGNQYFKMRFTKFSNNFQTVTANIRFLILPRMEPYFPDQFLLNQSVPTGTSLIPSGGFGNLSISITSGSIPPGLSLNSQTGQITGIPTSTGLYNVTFTLSDEIGNSNDITLGFNVIESASPLTISPNQYSITGFEDETPISIGLSPTGGVPPYTYTLENGTFPNGIRLYSEQEEISGTATSPGIKNVTIKLEDSYGSELLVPIEFTIGSNFAIGFMTIDGLAKYNLYSGVQYTNYIIPTYGPGNRTISISSGTLNLPSGFDVAANTSELFAGGSISGRTNQKGLFTSNLSVRSGTLSHISNITLEFLNSPSVAVTDSYQIDEDNTLNISTSGLLQNDENIDQDTQTALLESDVPTGHSLTLNTDGSFSYTPSSNFNGPISFTYKVNDGYDDSNTETVFLSVNPINDLPVATPQSVSTNEDTNLPITLSGTDPVEGDAIVSYKVTTLPTRGILKQGGSNLSVNSVVTNPSILYSPNLNDNGSDSFAFTVNDGGTENQESELATISITINPINDPPQATPQVAPVQIVTNEDTPTPITLSGLDPVENSPIVSYKITTYPQKGVLRQGGVTINEGEELTSPDLSYEPSTNQNGLDSFSFSVNDGGTENSESQPAAVEIFIMPVNDPPLATPVTVTTDEERDIGITPSGTDPVEGSSITTYKVITIPTKGILTQGSSVISPGTEVNLPLGLIYSPNQNENGSDNFTFSVNDGSPVNGESSSATISIVISPINDPPVATPSHKSTNEDTPIPITLSGTDPIENSPIESYKITTLPTKGSLIQSGRTIILDQVITTADVTYSPSQNENGNDSFEFTVNDGGFESAESNPAEITISITAVDDAPIANSQQVSLDEDTSLQITLSGADPADGEPITRYTVRSLPSKGVLAQGLSNIVIGTQLTNPDIQYYPSLNENGTDSFTFSVYEGSLESSPSGISITINPINDEPVAIEQRIPAGITTQEDTLAPITLTVTDVDNTSQEIIYIITQAPFSGTITGSFPNISYMPNQDFSGEDYFNFKGFDGSDDSNIARVDVLVSINNNIPRASTGLVETNSNDSIIIDAATIAQDADPTDILTFEAPLQSPMSVQGGTLSLSPDRTTITLTPTLGFLGRDRFSIFVNDNRGGRSSPITPTINIYSRADFNRSSTNPNQRQQGIDIQDAVELIRYIKNITNPTAFEERADINTDQSLNLNDIITILSEILSR
jgi:hypothetical protein